MKILLDTSVLVAAMVEAHPMHERALPWLQRIRTQADSGLVAAHSVAELYAILTTLPLQRRISPALAVRLIEQDVFATCQVISLTDADYRAVVEHLSDRRIVGGATYDALIVHAAAKADADIIVTLNERDLGRIYPDLAERMVTP